MDWLAAHTVQVENAKYHGQSGLHGQAAIKDVVMVYNNDTAHVSIKGTAVTASNKVQVKILPVMIPQHYVLRMIMLSPVERIHQKILNDLLVA